MVAKLQRLAKEIGRTPTVMDLPNHEWMPDAKTYHDRFGCWNKALQAAGLEANNNVGYGIRTEALDGHQCDSQAEAIIDDWLYHHNIAHRREVPYPYHPDLNPGPQPLDCDFVVKDTYIELFGVYTAPGADITNYDTRSERKFKLADICNINLIALCIGDLYNLEEKLSHLVPE